MRQERFRLTGLEIDGSPVRLVAAELAYTRRTLPTDGQADWVIAGTAMGPLPDGETAAVVAVAGARRFRATGLVMGVSARVRHQFQIRGSDGREIEELP